MDGDLLSEMGDHLVKHGDGVKDVAFTVQDCDFLVQVCSQFWSKHNSLLPILLFWPIEFPHDMVPSESQRARRTDYKGALHPGGQVRQSQAGCASDGEKQSRLFQQQKNPGVVRPLLILLCLVQYGDTTHTFVERTEYSGLFLPGFHAPQFKDALLDKL